MLGEFDQSIARIEALTLIVRVLILDGLVTRERMGETLDGALSHLHDLASLQVDKITHAVLTDEDFDERKAMIQIEVDNVFSGLTAE